MKAIAARDAKNKFGKMLDTVQREPLTIEKHGRAVAVIMSAQEYQQMKLERLRAKLAIGEKHRQTNTHYSFGTDAMVGRQPNAWARKRRNKERLPQFQ